MLFEQLIRKPREEAGLVSLVRMKIGDVCDKRTEKVHFFALDGGPVPGTVESRQKIFMTERANSLAQASSRAHGNLSQ